MDQVLRDKTNMVQYGMPPKKNNGAGASKDTTVTVATTIARRAGTSGKCNPKMPGASSFSKTDRYRIPRATAVAHLRVATIFVAAHLTSV
jgi:hypothetical protein